MSYKIAFFTPLHPQKTGIADWAEEMLPYLRKALGEDYEMDLFVENCTPTEADTISNHRILPMENFDVLSDAYDLYIYQMGNNFFHRTIYQIAMRHPGIIVQHDFAIHHLVANIFLDVMKDDVAYFEEVGRNHGEAAKTLAYQRACNGQLGLWETDAIDYPMNRTITKNADGVLVFSEYAKSHLEQYDDAVPIHRTYLHCSGKVRACSEQDVANARAKLGLHLKEGEKLLSVFGFIGRAKRPYSILEAAKRLKGEGYKFQLVYVGQLQDDCKDLPNRIAKAGLKKQVHMTGFTSAEDFDYYVQASDICMSLRYPTMGETSGVLMRALRYGKPSIVTNIGTFQEFPDDTVIKIGYDEHEIDELTDALRQLLDKPELCEAMRDNGVAYAAKYLEPEKTAEDIAEFIKAAIQFKKTKDSAVYIETRNNLLDKYDELGWLDPATVTKTGKILSEIFGYPQA